MSAFLQLQQLTAAQLGKEQRRGALVLDTRATDQFASFHIAGAMQIGLMGSFASWAAVLIEPTQKLILVTESANLAQEAHSRLARVGFENVLGYALADEKQWRQNGIELAHLPVQRVEDVRRAAQRGRSVQLIDVRSWAEWLKGHLPGANSVPLLELNSKAASIDRSKPTFLYCDGGYRSTIAASMLRRGNFGDIGILIDSVQGWQTDGVLLEKLEVDGSDHFSVSLRELSDR